MKLIKMTERRANTPDAQIYDEVRLVTVPRYKTSHWSGDEWRISYAVQYLRKGRVISTVDDWECVKRVREVVQKHAPTDRVHLQGVGDICDQESCTEKATVTYKVKMLYDNMGVETDPYREDHRPLLRKFCQDHSTRGDCGLEDADDNYEIVQGVRSDPPEKDVVVSGVVFL